MWGNKTQKQADNGQDALTQANRLADHLEGGGALIPCQVAVRLLDGEQCFGEAPARIEQLLEGESEYMHKSLFAGFGLVGITAAAATAAGNASRRRKAAKQAALQWRDLGAAHLYFTNRRILIDTNRQWNSIPLEDIYLCSGERGHIVLEMNGQPPYRMFLPGTEYYYVLLRYLAFKEVARPMPAQAQAQGPATPGWGSTT